MKIILANGAELNAILATGEKRQLQGAERDVLSFVFPESESLDTLDALFTPENCESITLAEVDKETGETTSTYIHKAYTIRAELVRKPEEVTPATEETEAVYENRVFVSMAQRTYAESKIAELSEALELILSGETEVA